MVELKFHVKLPIFVARQWIRHRTANVNELSGRYSIMKDEFYAPSEDAIKGQSLKNKQGRSEEEVPVELRRKVLNTILLDQQSSYKRYEEFLDDNIARELARINLPLSLYTEWYWKIDLHNLLHFLHLRMDKHAQFEIRAYAEIIGEIVKCVAPMAWEAFEDYVLSAERFSKAELTVIAGLFDIDKITKESIASKGLTGLEADEFLEKLRKI
jgi:thymidylate synthase (FAD)